MPDFKFFYPLEVRYGDLDPQGHVNNAKFLTYFEQGRIAYITNLGLWDRLNFADIGIILADAHITFCAPVFFGQKIQVGVRVSRLGNKSLNMEYRLEEADTAQELAHGSSVLVTYDYRSAATVPIPEKWCSAISSYEDISA
jgi:acyl-CoA thioester hydrolase